MSPTKIPTREDDDHRLTLTADDARALTDEVKTDALNLWTKLLRLHESGAHTALGYASWHEYCTEEFNMGKSRAYQVLDAARVVTEITFGRSTNGGTTPTSERVARELVPVHREDPEQVEKVWGEVIELHGPKPTAAEVRQVVRSTPGAGAARVGETFPGWVRVPWRLTAAYVDSPRKRTIAENAKKRLFDFVCTRSGNQVDDIAGSLRIEKAMPVLTDQEIQHLIRLLDNGMAQMRRLRRSLQKHLELRQAAP